MQRKSSLLSLFAMASLVWSLAACYPGTPQVDQDTETAVSPSEPESIIGTWASDSTEGFFLLITENHEYRMNDENCRISGISEVSGDRFKTRPSTGPDYGYCPESMTLKHATVEWLEIDDSGKLLISDGEGNTETFHMKTTR